MPIPNKKKANNRADRYEDETRRKGKPLSQGAAPPNRGDDESEHDGDRVRTGEFTREQIERDLARRKNIAAKQGEGRSASAPP